MTPAPTAALDPKEVPMSVVPTADNYGSLPVGTRTEYGTVVDRSLTAYRMANGAWVPFVRVHPRTMATPLAINVSAAQLAYVEANRPLYEAQNRANIEALLR